MRNAFLLVIGFCVCAGSVSADYNNPPGWENDLYFTHQSWSFGDSTNPSAPDSPYVSPGTPSFNMGAGTWQNDLGEVRITDSPYTLIETRQGGWKVDGPSGTVGTERVNWLTVDIPNVEDAGMVKELWVELTVKVTDFGHLQTILDDVDVQIYADGDTSKPFGYDGTEYEVLGADVFGDGGIWARFWSLYSIDPQPGTEQLIVDGWMASNQYIILDQIDIDTRCIPEPASMSLLGIGVLALVRRRKNR